MPVVVTWRWKITKCSLRLGTCSLSVATSWTRGAVHKDPANLISLPWRTTSRVLPDGFHGWTTQAPDSSLDHCMLLSHPTPPHVLGSSISWPFSKLTVMSLLVCLLLDQAIFLDYPTEKRVLLHFYVNIFQFFFITLVSISMLSLF